jgi:MarR-like DNA-binding transcriptional regulator SgrR of sgrS sRNA
MSGDAAVADLSARMSGGYEVQHLAGRVAACSGRVERVLARFREIQLLDWQSPAGRAYRNSVALQEVALGRARVRLEDALIAVNRHAQEVVPSSGSTPVGQYQWPR